jgi:hypothetical protein
VQTTISCIFIIIKIVKLFIITFVGFNHRIIKPLRPIQSVFLKRSRLYIFDLQIITSCKNRDVGVSILNFVIFGLAITEISNEYLTVIIIIITIFLFYIFI